MYIFSSIYGGLKIKASLSGRGSKERTAKVYILHNTREPIFAPTQCCGSGKIRKREDEERNLKKRRTRDRRNEEKDPRDKRKKGKKIKEKKKITEDKNLL